MLHPVIQFLALLVWTSLQILKNIYVKEPPNAQYAW